MNILLPYDDFFFQKNGIVDERASTQVRKLLDRGHSICLKSYKRLSYGVEEELRSVFGMPDLGVPMKNIDSYLAKNEDKKNYFQEGTLVIACPFSAKRDIAHRKFFYVHDNDERKWEVLAKWVTTVSEAFAKKPNADEVTVYWDEEYFRVGSQTLDVLFDFYDQAA